MFDYRPLRKDEVGLLDVFLLLAIHREDPDHPPPRNILSRPEVAAYIEDWGRSGDTCFVAVDAEEVIGAAWCRVFSEATRGYGYVDAITPEFAMAVRPAYRGRGIGTELMRRLIAHLGEHGFQQASLSVGRRNPAAHLYRRLGFEVVREDEEEFVMTRDL